MNMFFQAIKTCVKDKLFITGGRASRAEFWYFMLFATCLRLVSHPLTWNHYTTVLYSIINFIVFLGIYTVTLRRLHDTDRSGLHVAPVLIGLLIIGVGFFMMIPMSLQVGASVSGAGILYLLALCTLKGTPGANRYGKPMPLPQKSAK